jgi:hypothetical protein
MQNSGLLKKIFQKKEFLTMENRNHKDSLFIDLFCKDQKSGKKNFISLYNALHLLEYVSRIYEQIVPSEDRYEKKMIKIPYPEFYVFYNGTEEYPVEKELRLSDAFILPDNKYSQDKKISLEILVKVININIDKENPILKQCRALQEYSTLIELIRETKRKNPKAPLEDALSKAINDGILEDYLERKINQ